MAGNEYEQVYKKIEPMRKTKNEIVDMKITSCEHAHRSFEGREKFY